MLIKIALIMVIRMKIWRSTLPLVIFHLSFHIVVCNFGDPYSLITKIQSKCELLALEAGTRLGDHFNEYDEATEYDARVHNDYNTEYLGFAEWMSSGTWGSHGVTAEKSDAKALQEKGGWSHQSNLSKSAFYGFEDQWLYMMGDSTARQVWATFVSPFQSNHFERNAKEWTRENCGKQYPHRKQHPSGGHFPDEGWGGKCGNNEVTCHLSGYGSTGKFTFDWKHFPYEDYDEWLFGEDGIWKAGSIERKPDILAIQTGLHTCFHSHIGPAVNQSMIDKHEADLKVLMDHISLAIARPGAYVTPPLVIFITSGRYAYSDLKMDQCIWKFNRAVTHEAHKHGFVVLEREEIERRYLFRFNAKPVMHLDAPAPQIVGTSLLTLIACLRRNGTETRVNDLY